MGPSLKYPGAKWQAARWIVPQLPTHTVYVEPYFGSGAVFFSKRPSKTEYVNDLNGDVVNLFRVMRERPQELCQAVELTPYSREEYELAIDAIATPSLDPVERARQTLVRYWMSIGGNGGGRHKTGWRHSGGQAVRNKSCPQEWDRLWQRIMAHSARLKDTHIECRPALELLGRVNYPHTLAYIDPPYPGSTRAGRMYADEMLEDGQHAELLEFLTQDWQGMAVVSGYACELYDDLLAGWQRCTRTQAAEMGQSREEVLWISPNARLGTLWEATP